MAKFWLKWCTTIGACLCMAPLAAQPTAQPALPEWPAAPVMDDRSYPDCRHAYRARNLARYRAEDAGLCIEQIDAYYNEVLVPFRTQITAHQEALGTLEQLVSNGRAAYEPARVDAYLAELSAAHEAAGPDGASFAAYGAAETRYRDDRAFLEERFCRYAECEDYQLTAITTERDIDDGMHACGDAPGDTIYFEGLFGRALNWARNIPTETGLTNAIVAIGCRLEPEERQRAAEARDRVIEQDEIGATAQWISESRPEVSGSSTVTARNSQPNGAICLDITDVVIIDGEEQRAVRTMCRAPGESRYVLQA